MQLSNLKIGESCIVIQLENESSVKTRLNELGIIKGAKVTLVRKAPLLDPIEIKIKNYYLAIRTFEADKIIVEKIND